VSILDVLGILTCIPPRTLYVKLFYYLRTYVPLKTSLFVNDICNVIQGFGYLLV
jgi:hypothetical protein